MKVSPVFKHIWYGFACIDIVILGLNVYILFYKKELCLFEA